jgi:hypothetical protein
MTSTQRVALTVLASVVQRLIREGKEPSEAAVRNALTFQGVSAEEADERVSQILEEARAAVFGEAQP